MYRVTILVGLQWFLFISCCIIYPDTYINTAEAFISHAHHGPITTTFGIHGHNKNVDMSYRFMSSSKDQEDYESPQENKDNAQQEDATTSNNFAQTDTKQRYQNITPPPNSNSSVSPQILMRSLNTSPRRLVLGTLSASAIALTGNFGGITSFLLDRLPEDTVEKSGLDQYFPRGNYKRYKSEFGYTFVVPKEWVQDTALELAKVQRRSGTLDYSMTSNRRRVDSENSSSSRNNIYGMSSRPRSLPDVAFGPPGSNPDKDYMQAGPNVSVAVTKVRPGQTLRASFGSPTNAAETLLKVTIAPEGSGKVATLMGASEEVRGMGKIYTFEYEVDRGGRGVSARAISNIAVQQGGTVITMTVVAPRSEWGVGGKLEEQMRHMAESFKLTVA